MDTFEKGGRLAEHLAERVKLARLWDQALAKPERTVEDAKQLFEAQTAWKELYKRFVAEVLEDAPAPLVVTPS